VQFASLKETGPGSTLGSSPEFDANPFAGWQAKQKVEAGENAALINEGRKLFAANQCVNCHTIRGHEGGGVTAPDLTHIGSRTSIAAGVLDNSAERLHQWLKDPEYFKPGNKMYHGVGRMQGYLKLDEDGRPMKDANGNLVRNISLTDAEIDALVAYLHSLK
jgi:cytochrome c oxidase subunit 2